jgi:uncharacterized coiled-coil protein SlyX
VVVGTVSVTGLAYLDATRKINDKQLQIDQINQQIAKQDKTIATFSSQLAKQDATIATFSSALSTLATSVAAVEVSSQL